jgi:hypothetical protein
MIAFAPGGAPALAGSPGWTIVPSPNVGSGDNRLMGVAAVSDQEAWAVGSAGTDALIESWNGTEWTFVGLPALPGESALHGVDALPSGEAWAVGSVGTHTLVLRWQGAGWEVVPSPNVPGARNTLLAVSIRSADDVWAVGKAGTGVVVVHWNGVSWGLVSHPPLQRPSTLTAVLALPSGSVWAVGSEMRGGAHSDALSLRWTGTTWIRRAVPLPPSIWPRTADASRLTGLTAPGGSLWSAGYWSPDPGSAGLRTLTLRWSLGSWHRIRSVNDQRWFQTVPYGIDGAASDRIWAVGVAGESGGGATYAMRWNGATWRGVHTPNGGPTGPGYNVLWAVDCSGTIEWAVGSMRPEGGPEATLILRFVH